MKEWKVKKNEFGEEWHELRFSPVLIVHLKIRRSNQHLDNQQNQIRNLKTRRLNRHLDNHQHHRQNLKITDLNRHLNNVLSRIQKLQENIMMWNCREIINAKKVERKLLLQLLQQLQQCLY